MTQPQLRDLVKASNPVVTHQLLPDERDVRTLYAEAMQRADNPPTSADLLEQNVERRRDMQTQDKQKLRTLPPDVPRTRRWLVPVLGGAAALVALVLAFVLLSGEEQRPPDVATTVATTTSTTSPQPAASTPLEVAEALDAAIVAGDWEGVLALYADDATYTHLDDGFGFDPFRHGRDPADYTIRTDMPLTSERFTSGGGMLPGQWTEPLAGDYPPVDWDGAPGITAFDNLATLAMASYASGVTDFYSCVQADTTTVVCEVVIEGDAFWDAPPPASDTFTVENGLITHQSYDTTAVLAIDPANALRIDYLGWVEENRPELEDSLFWSEKLGGLRIAPDNVDTHRQLIAEWRVQR